MRCLVTGQYFAKHGSQNPVMCEKNSASTTIYKKNSPIQSSLMNYNYRKCSYITFLILFWFNSLYYEMHAFFIYYLYKLTDHFSYRKDLNLLTISLSLSFFLKFFY